MQCYDVHDVMIWLALLARKAIATAGNQYVNTAKDIRQPKSINQRFDLLIELSASTPLPLIGQN